MSEYRDYDHFIRVKYFLIATFKSNISQVTSWLAKMLITNALPNPINL